MSLAICIFHFIIHSRIKPSKLRLKIQHFIPKTKIDRKDYDRKVATLMKPEMGLCMRLFGKYLNAYLSEDFEKLKKVKSSVRSFKMCQKSLH